MAIDLEVLRKSLSDARAQTDPDPLSIAAAAEALGDALETSQSHPERRTALRSPQDRPKDLVM